MRRSLVLPITLLLGKTYGFERRIILVSYPGFIFTRRTIGWGSLLWCMPILIIVFLASNIGQLKAQAPTTWYVATSGGDSNDCRSVASACRTINGAVGKANAGDNVSIAAGVYEESVALMDKSLSVRGAGVEETIIDGDGVRVGVNVGATTLLADLTVRNGTIGIVNHTARTLTLDNVHVTGNHHDGSGSGILNDGNLHATNVTISGNTATYFGGGFYNHTRATAVLTDVRIIDNIGMSGVGGVLIRASGTVTMTNVLISGNKAPGPNRSNPQGSVNSGGMLNDGTLTMTDSIIRDNTALDAGGGFMNVYYGRATLNRVAISGNVARVGGGIDNYEPCVCDNMLTLMNVTISGNRATVAGGGLAHARLGGGIPLLTNVTVTNNEAPTGAGINMNSPIRLKNSIVANNLSGPNCGGGTSIVSLDHNLDSGASCKFSGPNDLSNTNPALGPLANNGGFGSTHALSPGSPAIDSADNGACPETDGRSAPRPVDGNNDGVVVCDRGAFEALAEFEVSTPTHTPTNMATNTANPTDTALPTATGISKATATPTVMSTQIASPTPTETAIIIEEGPCFEREAPCGAFLPLVAR